MTVKERIQALRSLMLKHNIAAVIVPGTDPHGSEYVAKHWKERNFISGFTGSGNGSNYYRKSRFVDGFALFFTSGYAIARFRY